MDPLIAQAVAEARIADLHREAAGRRLGRTVARRSAPVTSLHDRWSGLWSAAADRIATHGRGRVMSDPACCAA